MGKCPHCGRPITVGVMCADCADAISTNELFDMLTFGGRISDGMVEVLVFVVSFAGAGLLIFGSLLVTGRL